MRPAVAEVEFVEELLTPLERGESDGDRIFGVDGAAVGELELGQMRAVPTGERGVDRVGELSKRVRARRGEDPARAGPKSLAASTDQLHPNRQPSPRHEPRI